MKILNRTLLGLSLVLTAACGGGGGGGQPPPKSIADSLVYTNPTSGDYNLLKSTAVASTATHLVLDLVGPATGNGRGVAFTLSADTTKVNWSTTPALVQNVAFNLGTGTQILSAKVTGDTLQAGLFQKGTTVPAVSLNTTLARIALDLKSGVAVNSTVTLSAVPNKANVLPETGAPMIISVSTGTLQAQ